MKVRKVFKLIFFNIALLFIIIILLEILTFGCDYIYYFQKNVATPKYYTKIHDFNTAYYWYLSEQFRPIAGEEHKKRPIVLFGCSYTYGAGLKDNETFGYKLSEYTKRPVYNKAILGWGIQQMLWQLKNVDLQKEVKDPEYIIFTFIPDHINRLFSFSRFHFPSYIDPVYRLDKNGNLEEKIPIHPLYRFYFVRFFDGQINEFIHNINNEKIWNENFDLIKRHFEEAYKEIKRLWPDAKFVIIKYNSWGNESYINTPRWRELETPKYKDLIIINAEDLLGGGVHYLIANIFCPTSIQMHMYGMS